MHGKKRQRFEKPAKRWACHAGVAVVPASLQDRPAVQPGGVVSSGDSCMRRGVGCLQGALGCAQEQPSDSLLCRRSVSRLRPVWPPSRSPAVLYASLAVLPLALVAGNASGRAQPAVLAGAPPPPVPVPAALPPPVSAPAPAPPPPPPQRPQDLSHLPCIQGSPHLPNCRRVRVWRREGNQQVEPGGSTGGAHRCMPQTPTPLPELPGCAALIGIHTQSLFRSAASPWPARRR